MVSKKAQEIPPVIVMDVMEKAQELERNGEHIIHLEVGEPDFDTPECINEASYRAICEGKTHYTHSLGLIELREAIAEDYWKKYRVKVSPEQILVTSGTSPATMRWANPSTIAVLPTPASPISAGLFLVRRLSI